MELAAGDFIIYKVEGRGDPEDLDFHGMVLSSDDESVEISCGDAYDNCKLTEVKHVLPGSEESKKLAQQYLSIS